MGASWPGCKAICSDDTAFAGHRTMPSVMGIGNAAGLAAAMAAKAGCELAQVDVAEMQRQLREQDYPGLADYFPQAE